MTGLVIASLGLCAGMYLVIHGLLGVAFSWIGVRHAWPAKFRPVLAYLASGLTLAIVSLYFLFKLVPV